MHAMDKRSNLLQKFAPYGHKKFYNVGTWLFFFLALLSSFEQNIPENFWLIAYVVKLLQDLIHGFDRFDK
jgi:hypothetical protein